MDLFSLAVRLRVLAGGSFGATQGQRTHALLLRLVQAGSPELAAALHDGPGPRPYTVSGLRGPRGGAPREVPPGGEVWFRVTCLTGETFAGLLDALLRASARPLRLQGVAVELTGVETRPGAPAASFASYAELWEGAAPGGPLGLAFRSPTAFRSQGRQSLFPEPRLVFGGLAARWRAHTAVPLPELEGALGRLVPARYSLRTAMLDYGRYRQVGFVGRCLYEALEPLAEAEARALACLVQFAFYAGVGAKTAMGMGQAGAIGGRVEGGGERGTGGRRGR